MDKRLPNLSNWLTFSLCVTVILFPFSYHLFEFHTGFIRTLFAPIALGFPRAMGFSPLLTDLSSDSVGLYFHVAWISISSVPLFLLLKRLIPSFKVSIWIFQSILIWFLALILFKYGFDKLFLKQFPVPEPNLLYTPLGKMDKDLLFWSSMSTSTTYNILTGAIEVFTAILLVWRKTRPIGSIFSVGVFFQILIINLSFDISVKLFSTLLLIIAVHLAFPCIRKVWSLLVKQRSIAPDSTELKRYSIPVTLRIILLCLVFVEALSPYISSDSNSEPPLIGAYSCMEKDPCDIRRLFIHSEGFMIFQNKEDELADFKVNIDPINKEIRLTDYNGKKQIIPFSLDLKTEMLTLKFISPKRTLRFKKLNCSTLPLLSDSFHLTVDQIAEVQ